MKLKSFHDLGMNVNSDKFILPDHYMPVPEPVYRGDGQHSVTELQQIIRQYKEYCHQQALIKQALIKDIKGYE